MKYKQTNTRTKSVKSSVWSHGKFVDLCLQLIVLYIIGKSIGFLMVLQSRFTTFLLFPMFLVKLCNSALLSEELLFIFYHLRMWVGKANLRLLSNCRKFFCYIFIEDYSSQTLRQNAQLWRIQYCWILMLRTDFQCYNRVSLLLWFITFNSTKSWLIVQCKSNLQKNVIPFILYVLDNPIRGRSFL